MKLAVWKKIRTLRNPTSNSPEEEGTSYSLRRIAFQDLGELRSHETLVIKIGDEVEDKP